MYYVFFLLIGQYLSQYFRLFMLKISERLKMAKSHLGYFRKFLKGWPRKKNPFLKLTFTNSIRFPLSPLSDITGFYQETKTGEVNNRANKTDRLDRRARHLNLEHGHFNQLNKWIHQTIVQYLQSAASIASKRERLLVSYQLRCKSELGLQPRLALTWYNGKTFFSPCWQDVNILIS